MGAGEHQDFMPFNLAEVYKMIGVLFVNGLTPKPQFDTLVQLTRGGVIVWADNDKQCTKSEEPGDREDNQGKTVLEALLPLLYNARAKKNPLWKVQRLIDELYKQAKDMWIPGIFVAIDGQTIGYQGQSGLELQISYKQEGDCFQCNVICDSGYTFSFYFRHGAPPDLGEKYKDLDLSPMAK